MKKKLVSAIIILCLVATLVPHTSRAAVTPHFVAVNDTLLPFGDATMPYISGGVIYVPYGVFSGAGISASSTENFSRLRLQMGARRVDFYPVYGTTEDRVGDVLDWPPARREGGRTYVPLFQVCSYFGLSYEFIEVGRSVIPDTQIWVIRVMSGPALSRQDFVDRNKDAMLAAYNSYYGLGGAEGPGAPPEEPPPTYGDVTVYLSFFGMSSGGAGQILDMLDSREAPAPPACFFVSAGDIKECPGLIRRAYGSGHSVGIWFDGGNLDGYLEASALLFEAAKIRTVLVTANEPTESVISFAGAHGLVLWGVELDQDTDAEITAGAVIETLPLDSGERANLSFACTGETAGMLADVLLHLSAYEYSVGTITETVVPIMLNP